MSAHQAGPAPILLDFLIAHHPALYALDELVAQFSSPDVDPAAERLLIEEAVSRLVADGLVHRLERFVFASHAGVAGGRLLR